MKFSFPRIDRLSFALSFHNDWLTQASDPASFPFFFSLTIGQHTTTIPPLLLSFLHSHTRRQIRLSSGHFWIWISACFVFVFARAPTASSPDPHNCRPLFLYVRFCLAFFLLSSFLSRVTFSPLRFPLSRSGGLSPRQHHPSSICSGFSLPRRSREAHRLLIN